MASSFCRPQWAIPFLPLQVDRKSFRLNSCGSAVAGQVPCSPEELRVEAQARAAKFGYPRKVTQDEYALARYLASEHGSGTPETKAALALLALRQAQGRGVTVYKLLACTNNWDTCAFGPINVVTTEWDPVSGTMKTRYAAPYGRWAATSANPSLDDLLIARLVLDGGARGWLSPHANDQDSPVIVTPAKVRAKGQKQIYWVGPVPGLDPNEVFAWEYLPGATDGPARIDRALAFLANPAAFPWKPPQFCPRGVVAYVRSSPAAASAIVLAIGAAAVGGFLYWRRRRAG